MTYGFAADAMVRAESGEPCNGQKCFRAFRDGVAGALDVRFNLPGRHNVQNALAAIAVATELGVPDAAILKALAEFQRLNAEDPKDLRDLLKVGDCHLRLDQYAEAIETYELVARIYIENPKAPEPLKAREPVPEKIKEPVPEASSVAPVAPRVKRRSVEVWRPVYLRVPPLICWLEASLVEAPERPRRAGL